MSTLRDCLFNIFAANFYFGSRSSIRNLKIHHAVVTESQNWQLIFMNFNLSTPHPSEILRLNYIQKYISYLTQNNL